MHAEQASTPQQFAGQQIAALHALSLPLVGHSCYCSSVLPCLLQSAVMLDASHTLQKYQAKQQVCFLLEE